MTSEFFFQLAKVQAMLFILIKVAVLLKFFLFVKYRGIILKPVQFIYFPVKQISSIFSDSSIKVIKTQNTLTLAVIVFNVALVYVKSLL